MTITSDKQWKIQLDSAMKLDREKLKLIGGAAVVLAAICMMSGDLISYFAGLGRMFTLIGTVVLLAVVAAATLRFIKNKKACADSSACASANKSNTDSVATPLERTQGE
jgi:predicted lipid-binding transport protein (Tim44 family)